MQTSTVFRPSLSVFLVRTALAAAVTLVPFVVGGIYLKEPNVVYVGLALVMAFVVSFDFQRWLNLRQDYWALTSDSLIYSGQDGETTIPLPEIVHAHKRLWWTVQLMVRNSQGINMSYLKNPNEVALTIMSARQALLEKTP